MAIGLKRSRTGKKCENSARTISALFSNGQGARSPRQYAEAQEYSAKSLRLRPDYGRPARRRAKFWSNKENRIRP